MNEEYLKSKLVKYNVPEPLHDGLIKYILYGIRPGSFLRAILENNLFDTCNRADEENQYRLYDIVKFLYNVAPSGCIGSYREVNEWIEHKGLEGPFFEPKVGLEKFNSEEVKKFL